jgi:menaquinone-dependent protoporphyrinogen oxidase
MRILVSAASRHGSTAETATRIAGSLRAGLPADVVVDALPAAEVGDPTSYDAVVLGSAVYLGRWLDDARRLAERIAAQPPRPVWLFSVGPIGDPPKPDEDPAEVGDIVRARRRVLVDHALAGAIDRGGAVRAAPAPRPSECDGRGSGHHGVRRKPTGGE